MTDADPVIGGSVTDVPGLRVGHWTHAEAGTGCSVALFPEGTVASGEVRGGAPATRELEVLDPLRTVARIDGLVLTGGSAFGLATADGVMRFCEERGMGFPTPAGPVPIVVALGLFDLMVGDPGVRPGPEQGYAACVAATDGPVAAGLVGAGTGATVAASGVVVDEEVPVPRRPGGLVTGSVRVGELIVGVLVAVNAAGVPGADDALAVDIAALAPSATDPSRGGGSPEEAGSPGSGAAKEAPGQGGGSREAPGGRSGAAGEAPGHSGMAGFGNTTIGLVATNADLDKVACNLVAQGAHDGLARSVFPAHTRADGDAFVAASVGGVRADVDVVRGLAVHAVTQAIVSLAGR